MRSVKVGVSRLQDKREKPSMERKMSTASKATVLSLQSQPHETQNQYTRKELKEYKQLFNMFDTDGSGAIGNEELKQAMFSIGMHANEAEIDNLIKEVDADGNGEIDFEEFCACMKKSQSIVKSTKEELIRECFDIFDQDHNGIITESEFKYIAKEYGDFSEELAEKVFRELDVSANGHLSADQFATVVEDYLLYDTNRIEIERE
ncbi:EF hand [Trichostrongylus colubriformis]|uniref:EF hand n=1 Tax=Trichostrongylus colubriformis TaxID=6319 RepID=A0AAN8IF65_TRICO